MLGDWKDRIAGIKRIVLAVGVMSLCAVASQQYNAPPDGSDPGMVETRNAKFEKCAGAKQGTKLETFGCAVVLEAKVKASSIQFLSAQREDGGPVAKGSHVFKRPETQ